MSSFELLLSTRNKKSEKDLDLFKKGIFSNCLIVNQVSENVLYSETLYQNNIKMVTYKGAGLSLNRNTSLKVSCAEIVLITDDDVMMVSGYETIITDSFKKYPNADIIIFKASTFNDLDFRNSYPKSNKFLSLIELYSVSSIEIAFRRKKVLQKDIWFNESFGLGSKYESGEELLFLTEAKKKGLNILFLPHTIVKHPVFSSGYKFDNRLFFSKGALLFALYGSFSYLLLLLFCFKKKIQFYKSVRLFDAIRFSYLGARDFQINRDVSFNSNAGL